MSTRRNLALSPFTVIPGRTSELGHCPKTSRLKEGEHVKYAIVIEKAEKNYSAYVPDLPGCISTSKTIEGIRQSMREAIEFHIEGLRLNGDPVPEPTSVCEYVEVGAPEPATR
jgi:predicted RNase H-like HicB family nuclease